MQCLLPSQRYRSVFDIPLQELIASGIKGIIFDLDNTLTEWNKELSNETIDWLKFALDKRFSKLHDQPHGQDQAGESG